MKKAIVYVEGLSPYSQSKFHSTPKLEKELNNDYEERTWRERIHYDKSRGNEIFIPPMQFVNAIKSAAKYLSLPIPGKGKSTFTKNFESSILSVDRIYLGVTRDEVESETHYVPSDGRRGGTTRVAKTFCFIPAGWKGKIKFIIMDDIITEDVFLTVMDAAGSLMGIGRFRPRNWGYYGRFGVKKIEWITE